MNFRFEIPFLPALILLGTDMLARVAVQGIEQGLFSAMIDWTMKRCKTDPSKFFSEIVKSLRQSQIKIADALRVVC